MTAKGHILLASALAYVPIVEIFKHFGFREVALSFGLILLGALLPDIDEPRSYIGTRTKPISYALKLFGLKHRGFTHFFIVPVIISAVALFLNDKYYTIALLSLAFGILAHDVGDLLTKGGIYGFFYPFYRQKKIVLLPNVFRFETFSFTEIILNLMLLTLNIYLYLSFFQQIRF